MGQGALEQTNSSSQGPLEELQDWRDYQGNGTR